MFARVKPALRLASATVAGLAIAGCSLIGPSSSPTGGETREAKDPRRLIERELAPYLQRVREITSRTVAAAPPSDSMVEVSIAGKPASSLPAKKLALPTDRILNASEIEALRAYIAGYRETLGARGEIGFYLQLGGQWRVGSRLFVRFDQLIRREVKNNGYFVPIQGASVIAQIAHGRLRKLTSRLMTPPSLSPTFRNPGLEVAFSESELAAFMGVLKTSDKPRENLGRYLEEIAKRAKLPFDYPTLLNRRVPEQLMLLDRFLGSLGRISTARLFIDLAIHRQLSLVRYGDVWMFQVSGFFEMPIQFDVEIPPTDAHRLKMKNLRRMHSSVAINGFESPHFPGGKKTPGGDSSARATARVGQIVKYFADDYGWTSYQGKGSETPINVHTMLKAVDFRENAAWVAPMQVLIIGEGGERLTGFDNSLSVLGHEYTHAIIQFSSALAYSGESGALNEHFADIEGATIDAIDGHGGEFSFTVGEDVLTPAIRKEKEALLGVIFANYGYTQEQISSFELSHPSLRHLYAPALSFSTQYDHLDAYHKVFPADCQPSTDNDHCGIHAASGVVNKAASMIIALLGVEETREMFFNTIVYKLTPTATFSDYVSELYDECKETPAVAAKCDVVLASFAAVGIQHPLYPIGPQASQASTLPSPPSAAPQTLLAQASSPAASPLVKICGWVDRAIDDRIRLLGSRIDAAVVRRDHEIKTGGDYHALEALDCACVLGRITHLTDEDGTVFNAFIDVARVEDRGGNCAADPMLGVSKPLPQPHEAASEGLHTRPSRTYCGWVSVDSKTNNVSIVDNRYDTVIASAAKLLSATDAATLAKSECACVTGPTALAENGPGDKGELSNVFSGVSGVKTRPTEACVGLRWK